MKPSPHSLLLAALLSSASHVAAVHLSLRGQLESAPAPALARRGHISGLNNGQNVNYYTNITLGGQDFSVLVDTGSSDLYVAGSVPNAKDTGTSTAVVYAIGSAQGPIKTSKLDFAGYTVNDQAFLELTADADHKSGEGLIGLGPNTGSEIWTKLGQKTAGAAVVDRIFLQNMTTSNFLTVLLGRSDDPDDRFPGDLTLGELVSGYEAVLNQPKLNVTEVGKKDSQKGLQHWQVLLDAQGVVGPDGQVIPLTTGVAGTKNKKKLTAIFDTGFTLPQVPKAMADAIYSRFDGATYTNVTGVGAVYTLPCEIEVNVTIKIAGRAYPVHPLDTNLDLNLNLKKTAGKKTCIGSFQPITTGASPTYDMILGMAFLRNAYLLVNYGDFLEGSNSTTADPYIQLLSLTNDTAEAHQDFVQVRLDGDDRTGSQRLSASNSSSISSPSSSDDDDGSESFFDKHKTAVIIGAAVAGGLVLLGALAGVALCLGRKRQARMSAGKPLVYRPLHEPAPAGEMDQVQGYQAGTRYHNPWEQRPAQGR
ncbi:aspartic peptidase, partial [Heterobasidion irregulare TC 32-1]